MTNRGEFESSIDKTIERFDQRDNIFRRVTYDPEWAERAKPLHGPGRIQDKPGYNQEEFAFSDSAWYLERLFAMGNDGPNHKGLYSWDCLDVKKADLILDMKIDVTNPIKISQKVKRVARIFGASLVGITLFDKRWVYSRVSNDIIRECFEMEIPSEYRYVIVMAIEMDDILVQTSPTCGATIATGLGYSRMAFLCGLLAQFIRGIGYKAIPCGNDTGLSIPLAVQAGLGELGRNGLLITEQFGPRIQICKIFTDLPLVPDEPNFFGAAEFCGKCKKCAENCPPKAISFKNKTFEAPTESNNPGVLKWPINPEQCLKYWISNRIGCSNCIRVCPFNKQRGWIHDLARFTIKHLPWLNPLLIRLDEIFGYGKQLTPTAIWEE